MLLVAMNKLQAELWLDISPLIQSAKAQLHVFVFDVQLIYFQQELFLVCFIHLKASFDLCLGSLYCWNT